MARVSFSSHNNTIAKSQMWRSALLTKLQSQSTVVISSLLCLVVVAVGVSAYYRYTTTHLPKNITINNIAVGHKTYAEALETLEQHSPTPPDFLVSLTVDDIIVSSHSAELGLKYNYQAVLDELQHQATHGSLWERLQWRFSPFFTEFEYSVPVSYDPTHLTTFIESLNLLVSYQGEDPSVSLGRSNTANSLVIFGGKRGREVAVPETATLLSKALSSDTASVSAIVASTSAELSEEALKQAQGRAEKLVGESIHFTLENRNHYVRDTELVSFLRLPEGYNIDAITTTVATLAAQLNRPSQEPVLEYDPETLLVKEFSPPLEGRSLDQDATTASIIAAVTSLESADETPDDDTKTEPVPLAVATTPPQRSLESTNQLGIKERIGFGESQYDHSIPNRVHNVALTTQRVTNVIVPPGGEYSFNKALGDVSAATGFRSAYVIRNGLTELGDGGGVCQVSTTMFRAVLDAGLQVTRRLPHSYRVSYYELDTKPGIDATVYTGETDFRFVNDTPGHILIHAQADSRDLYMYVEIYGTSDGRSTEITDHITWNPRPAPAPQYFPDPTLPAGKLVQIDWAASGISSSFINVIKDKDGNVVREDKYTSHYRPWAAKYRQGTGP